MLEIVFAGQQSSNTILQVYYNGGIATQHVWALFGTTVNAANDIRCTGYANCVIYDSGIHLIRDYPTYQSGNIPNTA